MINNDKELPIGVFDSGVGGLTVVSEIEKLLPNEEVVYLGDTANLPYGDKSEEIVKKYSFNNTEFLLKYNIKVLVVACNTASAVALNVLKDKYNIPIIGVIEPAARGAVYATRNDVIGVIGTSRTIKSNVYSKVLLKLKENIKVVPKATPLFVPLIEEAFIDHEATKLIAKEYLNDFLNLGNDKNIDNHIDTLILGCTHYPLIKAVISDILDNVKLVDSAGSTAKDLLSILVTDGLLKESKRKVENRFFVTDKTEKMKDLAKRILNRDILLNEVSI